MNRGSPEYLAMTGAAAAPGDRPTEARHPVDACLLGDWLAEGAVSWASLDRPGWSRLIDYAFVEAGMAPRIRRAWIDDAAEGSDHLPLWLEID
jgi:endonuclease/exonuclease/phosphatase family metal-dependent hydrolase